MHRSLGMTVRARHVVLLPLIRPISLGNQEMGRRTVHHNGDMGSVELAVELVSGVREHLQGDETQSRIECSRQGAGHVLGPFVSQGRGLHEGTTQGLGVGIYMHDTILTPLTTPT